MRRKKSSRAASQLRAVSEALTRERQLLAAAKEIADRLTDLQERRATAEKELVAIQEILNADPDLTATAREMMEKALVLQGGRSGGISVKNPKHVSSAEKRRLLLRILEDFRQENPEADGMSYAAIKRALRSQYGIETASAGLFFRNELKQWESKGGNKNKVVVLKSG